MTRKSNYQPFQHPFLKIFLARFAHPWVTLAIYVPAGLGLLFASLRLEKRPWHSVLAWLVLGLVAWTLVEYALHRFAFHRTKGREPWRTFSSGLHIAHHRETEARDLILAPPFVGFLLAPLEIALFSLLSGSLARGLLIEVGLFLGYFAYEWVHWSVHFGPARFGLMRYWKAYHLYHHFKDPQRAYGVTSPIWDYVFGTAPKL
ncbi:MAG: sterol desaturase family protein [bacterium]